MDDIIRRAVERAIGTMQEKLGEQLTVDDVARSAMFSKFHFSRVFQQATGVSPGRFLSAMRLAEAKRLLLCTATTAADISHRVGYNSVGTFSARFSRSVGVSPSGYRQLRGFLPRVPAGQIHPGTPAAPLRGQVHVPPETAPGMVFVGLFPGRITEGPPAAYTVLDAPGPYLLQRVPQGTWHLVAHGLVADEPNGTTYTCYRGPITVQPGAITEGVDLQLHPTRTFDPPVLLALPDLRVNSPAQVAV
ncbi:AraC-type DNA-binding protein [Amycolatopsis arida]|uniref:AraC-type DNA-binding protein n=1 Tax=Amycolatopsis arida TaxID=587909 RepID=A0A1I5Q8T5_9PSEU|nr:AraC family transcriptional regulator [Amycolatopsis arida]TDX98754.1 AraC-like DNA-binding protein [Amycolatopsis arida]SFP42639.1 AraC-type DNA-binding protein [Amycolatopsis arida]